MNLFWVMWICNGSNGKAYVGGSYESCLTLKEAEEVVGRLLDNYDDKVVAAWIEERNGEGKRINIPFHEIYVDSFGNKRW